MYSERPLNLVIPTLYEDEELGMYDIIKSNTLQIMLDHS